MPTFSSATSPRKAATALKAVIRPVRGFSSDGTFSIIIEKRAEFGVDLDAVGVATEHRIGPDFEPRLVGTDAGEAQRCGDIDVRRKAAGAVTRRAVEDFLRRRKAFDRYVVLDQIGRALKPAWRLARNHGDRVNVALGGGAYRVKPKERTGRHQDACALRLGQIHQIPVFQKLADAQRHENPAAFDRRHRHAAEHLRRQAFDDHVAAVRERLRRDDRNAGAGIRQIAPRLVVIARGHCGERQPGQAGLEPPRHFEPDRTQSGQSDLESFPCHVGTSPLWPRRARPGTFRLSLSAGNFQRNGPEAALPSLPSHI